MLATRKAESDPFPEGPGWRYEVKWDGVRVLADTTDGDLRLLARTGRPVTAAYPELSGLASVQGAVLDGEVVVMAGGVPSFEALAERMHVRDRARAARLAARNPVTYVVFDVLRLYGVDVTRSTFEERRAILDRLTLPDRVLLSPLHTEGRALWEATREHGLEGVVAKRADSVYQPGRRSADWVKVPHRFTRTAAVLAWRPEKTTGASLGAVLLGAPDDDGVWRYLGKAGSGLAGRRGQDVLREVRRHERATPVADDVPAVDGRGATWCEPAVVVDVTYLERTRTGRLRQPVVRGLRTDVPVDPWDAP